MMWSPMLPENAPFTPEQRSWLNGFFAGLLSYDGSPDTQAPMLAGPAAQSVAAADPLADGDDGEAPWHDQTMPMAERMTLAEGRPLRRRMMAAMAQQDCGQCGYNCEDYANALFLGKEARLNLCVPGGKETARALKALHCGDGDGPRGGARNDDCRSGECRCPAAPAKSRSWRPSSAADGSTKTAPRRRRGTSNSISTASALATARVTVSACCRRTIRTWWRLSSSAWASIRTAKPATATATAAGWTRRC